MAPLVATALSLTVYYLLVYEIYFNEFLSWDLTLIKVVIQDNIQGKFTDYFFLIFTEIRDTLTGDFLFAEFFLLVAFTGPTFALRFLFQ